MNGKKIAQVGLMAALCYIGFAFMKLMEHVIDGIEGAELLAGSTALELSEVPMLTSFCITDAHNHLAMLEPPYYLRGNLLLAIDTMLATTGQVDKPTWNIIARLFNEYRGGNREI